MKIKGYNTLLIVILLLTIFNANAQNKDKTQLVLATESKRFEAMIQKDTATLNGFLDNQLVYIHSNALVEDKKTHLEAIESGRLVYQSLEREQNAVRFYKKIAINNGIVKVKGILNGQPFDIRLRYTATYIYKNKRYLLVNWQSTKIP